ncbi:pirin family protein [Acanthopleuribacter pedis]|uniref:Pirin family protein n=1 Tax=Acanthopleuribacter pedis TaxID=442870 RepID=A0A8J7U6F8_9BACT|nr:pirin family protein [Acanthopleuribacter pedis]MBO1321869.1 pirin family protein [Acanthopleuribacter pedis]
MITVRKAEDRGPSKLNWLDSKHTFSFAGYFDPNHMGFESLRVINDDRVTPGAGFGTHPHNNMEIITYVLYGALEHKDSMGNGSIIRPGDIQRMSAGTGVLHSEYNHSKTKGVHFLQIWILPEKNGIQPSYDQKFFGEESKRGRLALLASREARGESIALNQDADLYAGLFDGEEQATHKFAPGRSGWLHVARGEVTLNDGMHLKAGDGVAIRNETSINLSQGKNAEVLLFDLA